MRAGMLMQNWMLGFMAGLGLAFGVVGGGWSLLAVAMLATALTAAIDSYVKRRWPELDNQP